MSDATGLCPYVTVSGPCARLAGHRGKHMSAARREQEREYQATWRAANADKKPGYLRREREYRAANPEKVRERERAKRAAANPGIHGRNEMSRDTAHHHYYQWTLAELDVVEANPDVTAAELAAKLGRTILAVRNARRNLRRGYFKRELAVSDGSEMGASGHGVSA